MRVYVVSDDVTEALVMFEFLESFCDKHMFKLQNDAPGQDSSRAADKRARSSFP